MNLLQSNSTGMIHALGSRISPRKRVKRAMKSVAPWLQVMGWVAHWSYLRAAPVRWLLFVASLRGKLEYYLDTGRAYRSKRLAKSLGLPENHELVRRWTMQNYIYLRAVQVFNKVINLGRTDFLRSVPIEGLEHLEKAQAAGHSVIVLTAHFGYPRLLKYILEKHQIMAAMIASRAHHRHNKENRFMKTLPKKLKPLYGKFHVSHAVIEHNKPRTVIADFNIRLAVKLLQKPSVLVVLGDGIRALRFVEIPFLGHTLPLPTGIISIALSTNTVVCPAFVVDQGNPTRPKLVIHPPLELEKTRAGLKDAEANMVKFGKVFEQVVGAYPHLYKAWRVENFFEKRLRRSRASLEKRYKA